MLWHLGRAPNPDNLRWLIDQDVGFWDSVLIDVDWDRAARCCGVCNSAVMGDDGLTFAEKHVSSLFFTTAQLAGFNAKMKLDSELEDIRFCSMMMWPTADSNLFAPGPTFKALMKYGAFQTPTVLSEKRLTQELRGKALGLLPITAHVPLLHDMNLKVLAQTRGVRGNVVNHAKAIIQKKYLSGGSFTPSTYSDTFAAKAYRVSPGTIEQVRKDINAAPWNTVICTPAAMELALHVCKIEG